MIWSTKLIILLFLCSPVTLIKPKVSSVQDCVLCSSVLYFRWTCIYTLLPRILNMQDFLWSFPIIFHIFLIFHKNILLLETWNFCQPLPQKPPITQDCSHICWVHWVKSNFLTFELLNYYYFLKVLNTIEFSSFCG